MEIRDVKQILIMPFFCIIIKKWRNKIMTGDYLKEQKTVETDITTDVSVNINLKLSDLPAGKSRAMLAGVKRLTINELIAILKEQPANKDLKIVGFIRISDDKFIKVRLSKLNLLEAVLQVQEAHSVIAAAWFDKDNSNILCIG